MYRLTGINDAVIGSPVASRNNAQIENLIGYFVNTLVLRTNLSPGKSFIDTLRDVNNTTIEALAHQDIPFDNLVEIVSPERDISRNPLFQIAFALQNTHYNTNHIFSNDLLLDTQEVDTKISRFDLSLISKETEEGIECFFEYNTNLFYQSTIQKLVNYYLFLLEQILENPEKTIDSIPLVSSEEQNILLKAGQGAPAIYKEDKTAIELFEDVALQNHNKMAVKYYNNEINYKGLNKRANQLAHYLIENNVKKGSKVGICLNRSLEFVVSVLAVMKAGAVYVPIDPNYPEERIKFILDDSQPDIILTEEFMNGMFSKSGFNVMFLNDIQNKIKGYPTENIKSVNYEIEDLAYIIYTSGSTGTPKGVMVPHKGLCNVVISSIHEFKFNTETRIAAI
ncbi:AMP-binding protein [Bacillus megaterium]|nr:AMP-binding protein [Priestia megaterium]